MGARLEAIEYYFPEKKITTSDLEEAFPGKDFSKFENKIGVLNRYVAAQDETALDLAEAASRKLLNRIDKSQIDYILYCTQSPEYIMPSSACILQARLGLKRSIGALDINLGCSGYTYGLSVAKGLVDSGQAKGVLLVTTDTYSKFIHPEDRSNRAIFGDAAAVSLISAASSNGLFKFLFGTDGDGYNHLIVRNGGGRFPFQQQPQEKIYGSGNVYTDNNFYMNGPEVFRFTSRVIPPFIEEVLRENEVAKENIDQFVFHQANAHMLKVMRENLGVAPERFYINMRDGGNTVSSTIPIALKQYAATMEKQVERILVAGFGVGLSWSAGIITLGEYI